MLIEPDQAPSAVVGGPEGFLATIPEPLDINQTVALLDDMRSRLRQGPAPKNGHGRFERDREADGRDSSRTTEGTAP
jgi:hypothetical protein